VHRSVDDSASPIIGAQRFPTPGSHTRWHGWPGSLYICYMSHCFILPKMIGVAWRHTDSSFAERTTVVSLFIGSLKNKREIVLRTSCGCSGYTLHPDRCRSCLFRSWCTVSCRTSILTIKSALTSCIAVVVDLPVLRCLYLFTYGRLPICTFYTVVSHPTHPVTTLGPPPRPTIVSDTSPAILRG